VAKRGESPVVRAAVYTTMGLIALQILVAAVMVSTVLPAALRSAHQAIGVAIWVSLVTAAYLARIASGTSAIGAREGAASPTAHRALADGAIT
jgi:heme A synthase